MLSFHHNSQPKAQKIEVLEGLTKNVLFIYSSRPAVRSALSVNGSQCQALYFLLSAINPQILGLLG
jgi:hypothetical protein